MIGNSGKLLKKILIVTDKSDRPFEFTELQILPYLPQGGDRPQNLDDLKRELGSITWYMIKKDLMVPFDALPGFYQLTYKALYPFAFKRERFFEVAFSGILLPIVVTLLTELILHGIGLS